MACNDFVPLSQSTVISPTALCKNCREAKRSHQKLPPSPSGIGKPPVGHSQPKPESPKPPGPPNAKPPGKASEKPTGEHKDHPILENLLPHELKFDPALREEQLKLVEKFKAPFYLAHRAVSSKGVKYLHYCVLDESKKKCIEFGGDDLANARVEVTDAVQQKFKIEREMKNSEERHVRVRMALLCGASGYSMVLRNSEHFARYIFAGMWVSFQTAEKGVLSTRNLELDHSLLNSPPSPLPSDNLSLPRPTGEDIMKGLTSPAFQFFNIFKKIPSNDSRCFNVIFLGPSGTGKSRIINQLVNRHVCASVDSANSVTRMSSCISARPYAGSPSEKLCAKYDMVNMLDTVGLCDTILADKQVLQLAQEYLRNNSYPLIHAVVVIVSGRFAGAADHIAGVKQFLKWLKYNEGSNYLRFTFIYNKLDDTTKEVKEENLKALADCLSLKKGQPKMLAVGFPSQGGHVDHTDPDIQRCYEQVANAVCDDPDCDSIDPTPSVTCVLNPFSRK